MGNKHSDSKHGPAKRTPSTPGDEHESPREGSTTADDGYAEKHGPREDADGWGESNSGTGATDSQGHDAGERSFDHGPGQGYVHTGKPGAPGPDGKSG